MTTIERNAARTGAAAVRGDGAGLKALLTIAFTCSLAASSFIALIGSLARSLDLAPWQAGVVMALGGVTWVGCAPWWGAMSDRRGRRPVILAGVGGFTLTFLALTLLVAVAFADHVPAWLAFAGFMLLRALGGGFYAAVPAAGAALIADRTVPEMRAGALAKLGAASAAGMVAGPGLAGLLAGYALIVPLAVAAFPPLIASAVAWQWLPRAGECSSRPEPSPTFTDRRLALPLAVGFTTMFCVGIAQVSVGFFALDRLHLSPQAAGAAAGFALAAVGVALILAQVSIPRLGWLPRRLILSGGVVAALGFASVPVAGSPVSLWLSYSVAAFGMGWVFPATSATVSNAVEAHEQGWAAGSLSAAQGLGMILGPLAGAMIYGIDPAAPYWLVAALMAAVSILPLQPAGQRPRRRRDPVHDNGHDGRFKTDAKLIRSFLGSHKGRS